MQSFVFSQKSGNLQQFRYLQLPGQLINPLEPQTSENICICTFAHWRISGKNTNLTVLNISVYQFPINPNRVGEGGGGGKYDLQNFEMP